jgi:hypothetical protein
MESVGSPLPRDLLLQDVVAAGLKSLQEEVALAGGSPVPPLGPHPRRRWYCLVGYELGLLRPLKLPDHGGASALDLPPSPSTTPSGSVMMDTPIVGAASVSLPSPSPLPPPAAVSDGMVLAWLASCPTPLQLSLRKRIHKLRLALLQARVVGLQAVGEGGRSASNVQGADLDVLPATESYCLPYHSVLHTLYGPVGVGFETMPPRDKVQVVEGALQEVAALRWLTDAAKDEDLVRTSSFPGDGNRRSPLSRTASSAAGSLGSSGGVVTFPPSLSAPGPAAISRAPDMIDPVETRTVRMERVRARDWGPWEEGSQGRGRSPLPCLLLLSSC